jgi:hypothetical protein
MGPRSIQLKTKQTSWLTCVATMASNKRTAKAQADTANRARRPKSTPTIRRLKTLRALEEFIAAYVSTTAPSDGYAKLLPHTDVDLYFPD